MVEYCLTCLNHRNNKLPIATLCLIALMALAFRRKGSSLTLLRLNVHQLPSFWHNRRSHGFEPSDRDFPSLPPPPAKQCLNQI